MRRDAGVHSHLLSQNRGNNSTHVVTRLTSYVTRSGAPRQALSVGKYVVGRTKSERRRILAKEALSCASQMLTQKTLDITFIFFEKCSQDCQMLPHTLLVSLAGYK